MQKTKSIFASFKARISAALNRPFSDRDFWSGIENSLIEADIGVDLTARLIGSVRVERDAESVKTALAGKMRELFAPPAGPVRSKPHVILVIGVNGAGKTTTIAKLARRNLDEGKRVLLVAADTFRAAAVEQLKEWGARLEVEVVAQGAGADAAAVAFDGVAKAAAKGYDIVIVDTAGRLHTKQNLVEELKKISRVIGKSSPGAPHEKLLILDATVGASGLEQARRFHEAVGLTGAIVTKLDGTAKGGVILQVASELKIPITHIGVGEGMEDLMPFDARDYVESILGSSRNYAGELERKYAPPE